MTADHRDPRRRGNQRSRRPFAILKGCKLTLLRPPSLLGVAWQPHWASTQMRSFRTGR
jgi:hypothetical protein